MPKRKKPELTDKEQFERFVETARKLQVDDANKPLEQVFKRISCDKRKVPKKSENMPE